MNEIRFAATKSGKPRAYRFSRMQQRWFPMPLAQAELEVATGTAEDVTAAHAQAIATMGAYL